MKKIILSLVVVFVMSSFTSANIIKPKKIDCVTLAFNFQGKLEADNVPMKEANRLSAIAYDICVALGGSEGGLQ